MEFKYLNINMVLMSQYCRDLKREVIRIKKNIEKIFCLNYSTNLIIYK